jgi:hypothetical protein
MNYDEYEVPLHDGVDFDTWAHQGVGCDACRSRFRCASATVLQRVVCSETVAVHNVSRR